MTETVAQVAAKVREVMAEEVLSLGLEIVEGPYTVLDETPRVGVTWANPEGVFCMTFVEVGQEHGFPSAHITGLYMMGWVERGEYYYELPLASKLCSANPDYVRPAIEAVLAEANGWTFAEVMQKGHFHHLRQLTN